jgi:hypothetical protein
MGLDENRGATDVDHIARSSPFLADASSVCCSPSIVMNTSGFFWITIVNGGRMLRMHDVGGGGGNDQERKNYYGRLGANAIGSGEDVGR